MLVLGNTIDIIDHVVTLEGTWVQLDKSAMTKYCFNSDGEAWSLSSGRNGAVYLQAEDELFKEMCTDSGNPENAFGASPKKGFDFINTSPHQLMAFGLSEAEPTPAAPFKFQPHNSPGQSPEKTSEPKGFWDEPAPSTPPKTFFFGPQTQTNVPPPPKVVPRTTSDGERRHSTCKPPPDAEREKDGQKERRQSSDGGKFASLQRWLKGDDGKKPPERPSAPPRGDMPPELVGVSVRDLVKAIGESSSNGNTATPPSTPKRMSRSSSPKAPLLSSSQISESSSSSPVPIPGRALSGMVLESPSPSSSPQAAGSMGISPLVSSGMADFSSQRRSSTQSDTSAFASSLTRDQSSASPGNTRDLSPGSSCSIQSEGSTKEDTIAKQAEQESDSSSKSVSQAYTQTSPEGTTVVKGRFSMGTAHSAKDETRLSPKLSRKADRSLKARGGKRAVSPSPAPLPTARVIPQPVKEAVSPSVAESLRAVFAAFLWHEGIVHDAMACASFLKFHPNLPKQGAVVVTRPQPITSKQGDKVRQRHSVEVTNAGSYLHIQPATLESLTRSAANANANRSRTKKPQTQAEAIIREESGIPGAIDGVPLQRSGASSSGEPLRSGIPLPTQTVAILPPALKALVLLWEQLSTSCLQAINNQAALLSPNPSTSSQARSLHRLKQKEKAVSFKDQDANKENKDTKKSGRKKKEWRFVSGTNAGISANGAAAPALENETVCELCGNCYPHPVTYHMRVAHPGCGAHAGGKGYNSGGNFCVGWAGNCGDGGIGGSSWYLVCDACRDRYLRTKKSSAGQGQPGTPKKSGIPLRKRSVYSGPGTPIKMLSPGGAVPPQDVHIIMRNNAMFLLELASAAGSGLHLERRPSPNMPTVAENYSPQEASGPFTPVGPFQCLAALGANPSQLREDAAHSHAAAFPGYPGYAGRAAAEESNGNGHGHGGHRGGGGARPVSEFYSDMEADGARGRGLGLGFHRSVSMGTNGASWSRREGDGRVVMMRRRNNSGGEQVSGDGGSYLLCYPSAALQKLVPNMDRSAIVASSSASPGTVPGTNADILSRPVMTFLFQHHNLESLQFAMKQALRKASCRVYAMQALNWLLHNVSQPCSLHDLLWWLVAALTSSSQESEQEIEASRGDAHRKDDLDMRSICEHPLSDISIAGEAVHPLPSTFHGLLQSVADLMLLLPPGSALQQMAVQCWGLRFTPQDHVFLHRSQVFSNISKILSHTEEEQEDLTMSMNESHQSSFSQVYFNNVEILKDLTPDVDIKASSRQAMVMSLTDNSTETFWESGDEDRNKTKIITITCDPRANPRMIYIHVDNCRDLANKVSSVILLTGQAVDELYFIQQTDVENRSTGWICCPILEANHSVIRLELKGPDNSLRLRQVRILGDMQGESTKVRQRSALTIQQRNCEAETLRVFRLITSQVFGKLLQQQQISDTDSQQPSGPEQSDSAQREAEENNDLKEHMVGILFSRSKLTHLQKQVVIHIVQAIRKEALHVREEWEILLCSPPSASSAGLNVSFGNGDMMKQADAYCFEMLSMVLALSGSSVGKAYLSQQHGLIRDVLSLLHTGSARVQRQVTSLLRRMLPEVAPQSLGSIMNIGQLPPADFSIVTVVSKTLSQTDSSFDIHKVSILDVFLSCIAKALTVQVKVKGKEAGTTGAGSGKGLTTVTLATSIHPRDFVGARWWLRGCITRKLAEVIIQLLKDMAAGKISDSWAEVTKGAIAESILNLTRLGETERAPTECLRTPTLWLALAALCVLDSDHVERLSSGEWRGADGQPPPPRPLCSNHDDGETGAIIQCSVCGNLCAECDRFLHLHRRTRMHQRQVCKEEEEAIKVDLHEGCGRTKLFWVMALADSSTLKAMVEFRERRSGKSANFSSGTCRFCGATGNTGLLAISNVCADQECQEHAKNACTKHNPCGHVCGGIVGETACLPCLHGCSGNPSLKQDADDMCMICFTEALSCAPAVQLSCGHVFHLHCCQNVLSKRWPGPRITFGFSQCPICKAAIEHEVLNELLGPIKELLEDVRRKALMRLEYEGLHQTEAITTPGARFYNDPAAYAMDRYAYYVCFKCNKAYYGGEARCDAEMGEQYDPTELVCGGCSDVASAQMCPKHGTDFLEYKCRYCCSVAVFFCFGSTHFCNPCHDDFQRVTNIPKNELPSCPAGPKAKQLEGDECPLHVKHPPTGEEFALGCGVCRNAHTF
ncbi:E3 ubiquitin-protein ligase MYCBP2-like [Frankliniella occidentalis]|uniref:RCR-type E3 ubiquitin transferase n=1 Tax=Frankliniella occidentalis TaxID=133901 RepID=A0A9C6WQJ0_FRAOC|nr:E3 ubiquitin-protein ligase MYCBP2-like [Frankliniella occidentalis]